MALRRPAGPAQRPPLVRRRGGWVFGALAVAPALAVGVVAHRPAAPPSARARPSGSPAPSGIPFFGLFPLFAFDPDHQQVVLLDFRAQTWLWSNHQWTQAHAPVTPPARTGAAVAWNPGLHAVLLFGGLADGGQTLLRGPWAWDGSTLRGGGPRRLPAPPNAIRRLALGHDLARG